MFEGKFFSTMTFSFVVVICVQIMFAKKIHETQIGMFLFFVFEIVLDGGRKF
jgi:hypothetical protein